MTQIQTHQELEQTLGEQIKMLRLNKNLTRQSLCLQAGISENALRHLEGGQGATIKTFIHILKALGQETWLQTLVPTISINPLHLAKKQFVRQRASGTRHGKKD